MEEKDCIKEESKNPLSAQRKVVKSIIGKGIRFHITYTEKVRQKGFLGFFGKKVKRQREEEYALKEPTLAVLDRASEVWLRMDMGGLEKEGANTFREGFKLARKHAHDMAECLAILVLGEEYYAVEGGDDKEIERLTELFYKTIRPSQISEIAIYANAASNIVDFVSSMRLMTMSITTTPTERIE